MAEPLSSASLFVRQQAQGTSRFHDDEVAKVLDPNQSIIFAIPTHITTHAPGASDEDLAETESESSSSIRLEGRPAPTPKRESQYYVQQKERQLEAQKSIASSAPSSSSQNTVKSPQSPLQRTKSVKQQHADVNSTSLNVEQTPFPGLSTEQALEPPSYNSQSYSTNLYGNAAESPSTSQGRFPRWRGWLEKRALERHLERLDIAAATTSGDVPVQRKKSWGAGIDDENALSDGEDQEEVELPVLTKGPLHLHQFGSRFISHLPSLPLCSAYLDLPPAPQSSRTGQRLLRRSIPEGIKRKVLLIGTSEGLYVAETRRRTKQDSFKGRGKVEGKKKEQSGTDWNVNIRCRKVWSGMGVYQMSILSSKSDQSESRTSKYGFSFLASPPQDVSILLALCSTVKDTSKAPIAFTSAHSNPTTSTVGGSSSKDGLSPSPYIPTSHFGIGNGGGPTKVLPPSGSGTVRMWSLEALRRVVAHTLDTEESKDIDMLYDASKHPEKKSKLAMRIRKAWASLGEPSSDRKARRTSRQLSSQSTTYDREATPMINEYRSKMSAEPEILSPVMDRRSGSQQSTESDQQFDEFGQVQNNPATFEDSGYEEIFRLARSSVLIRLPGNANTSSQPVNLGQGDSLTSLKSDESMGTGPASTTGHGSSSQSHTSAGRGVLFFSIFEASTEVGTSGTWYLALATAKSIYLYEAARPSSVGESRTWVFVKEYYTPLPAKGIAFTYSEATEAEEKEVSRAPTPSRKHHQSQQSLLQTTYQHQVKSSPYSSVFRYHSDLTLFVSFGKRAILIRAGDANIKEVEKNFTDTDIFGSVSSDAGHGKNAANAHKRRSLSAELLGGTEVGFGSGQWVGAERVISQVILRCKHHSPVDVQIANDSTTDQTRPVSRFGYQDDDDDDDDDDGVVYDGLGVTLEDKPLPLRSSTSNSSQLLSSESVNIGATTTAVEPTHILHARIALLTKGAMSHLFPLPLSWDLHQQRPLSVFAWSDVPSAVAAWSKVVGLERDLSSGPISISSLGSGRKKVEVGNAVTLHVQVTAVAFLASRIELKKKKIKIVVKVPFFFNRDSELVLESLTKEEGDGRMQDEDDEEEGDDETDLMKAEAGISFQEELVYPCAMLSITGKGLDVAKPWEAGSDAGVWAFDWRGANDYRLFYLSAQV